MKNVARILIINILAILGLHAQSIEELKKFAREEDNYTAKAFLAEHYYFQKQYDKALPLLKSAVEQNHPVAMYYLALMYKYGKGIEKNEMKAIELLYQATFFNPEDEDYYTYTYLPPELYQNAERELRNFSAWFEKIKKQANAGDRESIYLLGICYFEGIGTNPNKTEAQKYLLKAREDKDASHLLGHIEYENKNFSKAKEYFTKAANKGETYSMHHLGDLFLLGKGTPENPEKALDYYKKAASKGNPLALETLINAYLYGNKYLKIKPNPKIARSYYDFAIQNNVYLANLLLYFYDENKKEETREMASLLAKRGNIIAQEILAEIYLSSDETEKASFWFHIAKKGKSKTIEKIDNSLKNMYRNFSTKNNKDKDDWAILGDLEYYGLGTSRNIQKAVSSYKRASEKGSVYAMEMLADIYFHGGTGFPANKKQAEFWAKKAIGTGSDWAKEFYQKNNLEQYK